ncbi:MULTISPECIES: hypothetical protein [unclassified Mesorhizobium]|nr:MULTISPECIES: hypothetical protein [unclassified Mesorhizobium]
MTGAIVEDRTRVVSVETFASIAAKAIEYHFDAQARSDKTGTT